MFYKVELVKIFEFVTRSETSFCVIRFFNSIIPNLSSKPFSHIKLALHLDLGKYLTEKFLFPDKSQIMFNGQATGGYFK